MHHLSEILLLRQPTAETSSSSSSSSSSMLWTSPQTPIAVLNDLIKIVCLVFVKDNNNNNGLKQSGGFDLSKIEAAKLEAIQVHGDEAVHAACDFSIYDTEACLTLVDTIYDTVGFLQPAMIKMAMEGQQPPPGSDDDYGDDQQQKQQQQLQVAWGFKALGVGLDQASKGIQTLQSMIAPHLGGCETQDTQYRQGAEEVTYETSMLYGLAGAAIASAPKDSAVKALDLGQIIVSVAQLAIGCLMAQNVARMAGLDPEENVVKTTIYMTLAGEVEAARDLNRLRQRAMQGLIPKEWVQRMDRASAEMLVMKGPGGWQYQSTGPSLLANVPVLGNVFAFSDQWLSANRVGNDIKFVFCPDVQKGEEEKEGFLKGVAPPPPSQPLAGDVDETVEEGVDGDEDEQKQQGQVEEGRVHVEDKVEL
ncbi:hypothetical protein EC968_002402 [Mortierella alpina]|nr:hypothetical protein EC968_002402 [Mortierella alpina]